MKYTLAMLSGLALIGLMIACAALPEKEFSLANERRNTLKKYKLDKYASNEFIAAETNYTAGKGYYSNDNGKSKESLDKALSNYQLVMDKGFPAATADSKKEADQPKKQADDIKASVAVKTEYDEAQALYDAALKAKSETNYAKAIDLLQESKKKFQVVAKKAKEKRTKADTAIRSTDKDLAGIEATAKEIERLQAEEKNSAKTE
ncbi:MAG: hypothetical protein AABZ39_11600 [Spirochaetota bacterium]